VLTQVGAGFVDETVREGRRLAHEWLRGEGARGALILERCPGKPTATVSGGSNRPADRPLPAHPGYWAFLRNCRTVRVYAPVPCCRYDVATRRYVPSWTGVNTSREFRFSGAMLSFSSSVWPLPSCNF